MSSQNSSVSIVQRPDRFGRPSGVLGAFAERSALPSGVRGIPTVLGEGHCAGTELAATKSEITVTCQGRMSLGRGKHHGGYEGSRPPIAYSAQRKVPNIDPHTCKKKIRHRCWHGGVLLTQDYRGASPLKEKHIQRWDLLSGISPRPVLILARVGAGQRDFYTTPKLPARFVLMNPLWSNRVPVKLAHSIAAQLPIVPFPAPRQPP